jgi:hypothetical protein
VPVEGEDQLDALVEAVVGERVEPLACEGEAPEAGGEVGDRDDADPVQVEGGCRGLGEQGQSSSS